MRILVGSLARGRPAQYHREIEAALPPELSDATFAHDLGDDVDAWGEGIAQADVIILNSRGFGSRGVASARCLRFVQKLGIDTSLVDVASCRARGIPVSVLPDLGHVAVAEHTLAMILAGSRNLVASHQRVVRKDNPRKLTHIRTSQVQRHVNWLDQPDNAFPLVCDATLGLVGFGEIAREVAKRASGLFQAIVYTKRRRLAPELERQLGVSFLDAADFYRTADIVSMHATLPQGAPPIVGARELAMMKPGAYFVNTARGHQVDQVALIDALRSGRLRGAALDVFETEPVQDDALLTLPNVILTPHTAIMLPLGRRFRDALLNVAAFAAGRSPAGLLTE